VRGEELRNWIQKLNPFGWGRLRGKERKKKYSVGKLKGHRKRITGFTTGEGKKGLK